MYDMASYTDVNCTGTATLLEAVVKNRINLKRFVLSSSRAVYGEGSHTCPHHGAIYPDLRDPQALAAGYFDICCPECGHIASWLPTQEDRVLNPRSLYAWTKMQQEQQCRYAAETFNIPITILRYFNVYGSGQSLQNPYTGVVSIFYSRLISEKPIYLYENGLAERDFVHVSDIVQANVRALEADMSPGTCFNVGSGKKTTILEIAQTLAHTLRRSPYFIDRNEFRVGDIRSCIADIFRSKKHLSYNPQMSLKAGMREFASWAIKQKSVDLYEQSVKELIEHGLFKTAEQGAAS
jgi:dTDP-L-rhamnose 4-epimerase